MSAPSRIFRVSDRAFRLVSAGNAYASDSGASPLNSTTPDGSALFSTMSVGKPGYTTAAGAIRSASASAATAEP